MKKIWSICLLLSLGVVAALSFFLLALITSTHSIPSQRALVLTLSLTVIATIVAIIAALFDRISNSGGDTS